MTKESSTPSIGLVYVGFGYEYLLMAIHSARSAKESNPGIGCTLVTNIELEPLEGLPFETIVVEEARDCDNRFYKTSCLHYVNKYKKAAYIDCDTEIRSSLEPAFTFLDYYDIAMKINPLPSRKQYHIADDIPGHLFPSWNSGVIFFVNDQPARGMFSTWHNLYRVKKMASDQPALARAVFEQRDLRLLSLGTVWNTFPEEANNLERGVRDSIIWHYRSANDWLHIAPTLSGIHDEVKRRVVLRENNRDNEVEMIGRKYRILSSITYRMILQRRWVRRVLRKLAKEMNGDIGVWSYLYERNQANLTRRHQLREAESSEARSGAAL